MDQKLIFFYLQGIWRRRWIVVAICWVVCIAGWTGVFKLRDVYESDARVYVDVNSLLTPLLQGLAVETNPLVQLDYMQRTLLSRPNLQQVIHLANLDDQAKTPDQQEGLLQELASDVKVGLQGNDLFSISYQDNNPIDAKNIVQAVLTVFSETLAGNSRADMDNARRFLEEQIADYEQQLRAAEARRVEFQAKYADILPAEQANRSRLDDLRDQLQKLQLSLQEAEGRRGELNKALVGVPPTIALDQAAAVIVNAGNQQSPIQAEISDDQRKLIDLQTSYTDSYPDIIALKQEIASLEEISKKQAADAGKNSGTSADPTRQSTVENPVYEQLKVQLADADGNVAAIQLQIKDTSDDQKRVQAAVDAAPGVELQSENLDRDYNVLKQNYDQLVERRDQANMAQAAATQADQLQFRIVDAPQVPLSPIAPNRPVLYSGVLIAGLGAGVAAAFLLLQLDRSFANVTALRELGFPVLGTVSRLVMIDVRGRMLREVGGLAATAVALLLVYGTLLLANSTSFRGVI